MTIRTINPATGEPGATWSEHSIDDAHRAIRAAHQASREWRRVPFSERGRALRHAAQILRHHAEGYARLMAQEMGKPVRSGQAEIEKCAWVCEHYAEFAESYLSPEHVKTDATASLISYRPIGVVLAVMPWNYPFWQVFRAAAPNLMAGNAIVLKHASNVPGCAKAIEALFRHAGVPDDLFASVLTSHEHADAMVESMLAAPEVRAVTLTGSVRTGQSVASRAGAHVKKCVLELGGSDAYVVLDDADLDLAVEICARARLENAGQSCIGAKRMIVVDPLGEPFEQRFVRRMRDVEPGDPLADSTELGPMARDDLRDELHRQVVESAHRGARLRLGGQKPDRPGAWYPPTVLTDVGPSMPAWSEELFGPAAAVIRARDEQHAIAIANDTVFGLGASVFTRDTARGLRIAAELEAGNVFVNTNVRSDPRLPFGGIKQSGYGRELGVAGIREFVNACTIVVA